MCLKLSTPLGVIRVFDNGIEIDYDCIKVNNNEVSCPNLEVNMRLELVL